MGRFAFAVGACVCVAAVAAAMAREPETNDENPHVTPVGPAASAYPSVAPPAAYYAPAVPAYGYPTLLPLGYSPPPGWSPAVTPESLAAKWKAATESDRPAIETEMRDSLKKDLQARLASDEIQVKQLEAQAKELREKLELRRQKQDEIVDFRMQEVLRTAQGLGWEQGGGPYATVYAVPACSAPARLPPSGSMPPQMTLTPPPSVLMGR